LLWRNHFPKFAAAPLGLAAVASIFQPWTGEFVNAFFITQYLPLFLLGIALHDFTKDRIRNSKNWSSLVVFLLVMSIESVSREAQISNQATKNQVSVVICAIVLVLVSILVWVAAHADFAQRQSKTSAKWARYLGPRTYQFYLVHLTSAGTITNILASSYGFLYNWGGICVFVVSLVLADATYRLSESGKLKQYFTLGKTRAF
jgi:peptidoglycan/LPS O-acetylase OafA/YrhL